MMSSQPEPKIIFDNQPTTFRNKSKNDLLKGSHGYIKGTGTTKFPKVRIENACGELFVFVEPVYAGKQTLLHHYRLVRYDQLKDLSSGTDIMDPLWYKLDEDNHYTIDLPIVVMSPGYEHQREGVVKLKEGDLNDKKMVLCCKLYSSYKDGKNGENLIATQYSNPLENLSQPLPVHKIVGEGSVDGGTEIRLPFSRDHSNTTFEVIFSNKRDKFIAYGEITRTDSKWIYVKTPAYILENTTEPVRLTEPVKISVHIVRVRDGVKSNEFHFIYTPRETGTSQDEIITISDMISGLKEIWIICSGISIPNNVIAEEYVKANITVRFSENNVEYTDVKIKKFVPIGTLILETSLNFYEKFGDDATIQINNTLCNTLSEKFKMKFPEAQINNKKRTEPYNEPLPSGAKKPKISMDTVSTSTDLTNQFQNDPNQQEQSSQNQQTTYLEPNASPNNCGEIHKDANKSINPSDVDDINEISPSSDLGVFDEYLDFDYLSLLDMNPNCADLLLFDNLN